MKKLSIMLVILLVSAIAISCTAQVQTPAPAPAATTPPAATTAPTASPGQPQAKYGGSLILGQGSGPANLGFIPKITGPAFGQAWAAVEPLLLCDDDGTLIGHLATEWKVGPDGKSITLNLRKGVKFHDGTEFNAEAVKFNLEKRKEFNPAELPGLTSIDIIDTYTIRLNIGRFSDVIFNNLWAHAGMIASPAQIAKGEEAAQFHPVGTGPFKFNDFKRDVHTKYTKFDGYWQKDRPYLDAYNLVVIPDATTRLAALLKGEVNILSPAPAKDAKELREKGYALATTKIGFQGFLGDSANPDSPYADVRVRQAIDYAIDNAAINATLGYGFRVAVDQYAQPESATFNPALTRPYNPAKAKQLLAEAGYPNGFKTTIIAPTGFTDADHMAFVKDYLSKVGIDATVDLTDQGRYLEYRRNGWKNALLFYNDGVLRPFNLHSSINSYISETAKDFISFGRPAGWQALLDKALYDTDKDKVTEVNKQLVKWIFDEALVQPLWCTEISTAHISDIHVRVYHSMIARPWSMWDARFIK